MPHALANTTQMSGHAQMTTASQGLGSAVGGGLGQQFSTMQTNAAMNLTNMHSMGGLGLGGISSGMNVTGMNGSGHQTGFGKFNARGQVESSVEVPAHHSPG